MPNKFPVIIALIAIGMGCLRLYEATNLAAAILAHLSQTLTCELEWEMSEIPTYLSQTLILRNKFVATE